LVSSSAAMVGGLIGANTLLNNMHSRDELVTLTTHIEERPDNVAPALLGGLIAAAVIDRYPSIASKPWVPNL
jgi:homoserine kinase